VSVVDEVVVLLFKDDVSISASVVDKGCYLYFYFLLLNRYGGDPSYSSYSSY
jgi:hypothetical protein